MDFTLARQILRAAETDPDGYEVHGRKMRHEAELMREAGWLEITKSNGARSTMLARLTEAGHRVGRLFERDAAAQRLLTAFLPRSSSESP